MKYSNYRTIVATKTKEGNAAKTELFVGRHVRKLMYVSPQQWAITVDNVQWHQLPAPNSHTTQYRYSCRCRLGSMW